MTKQASPEILNRKGARKAIDIPTEIIKLLNEGKIETVNLTEWLAADQLELLRNVLGNLKKEQLFAAIKKAVEQQKKPTANSNTKLIGAILGEHLSKDDLLKLKKHPSDLVRNWTCWSIASQIEETKELLTEMRDFAADSHFGVREVVIFASKDKLAKHLELAVEILLDWSNSKDENVRRFVAEVLRPIGVWTKKIDRLQTEPELGFPLLNPLKSDPSKYVQNSVANWLNDASKSNPKWVEEVCKQWMKDSKTKETTYIVKRAMRTINK